VSALNLEVGFTVDWIAATFNKPMGLKFAKKLGYLGWASDVDGVCPKGYNQCRQLETGALVAWHDAIPTQGVHVRLSGSCLRYYQEKGVDWHQMLTWVKQCQGRTSRVDLAVDIKNSQIKQSNLCKQNRLPYQGRGRTPRWLPVGDQDEGWTWYVGSRQSDKYLRIYDKAKEQKNYVEDYIRVELETKGEVAHAVGHEFPTRGKAECKALACTLIKGMANIDHPSWVLAMECEPLVLALPQGRERDTFGWLVKICAPALARQIALRPNDDVLDMFWNALRASLRERGIGA